MFVKLSFVLYTVLFLSNAVQADNLQQQLEAISSLPQFKKILESALGGNLDVSPRCKVHLQEYWNGITSFKLWALKMLDSGSKIPSGILEGNIADFGSFDECIDVEHVGSNEVGKIMGKYCYGPFSITLPWTKNATRTSEMLPASIPGISLATCLPSTCTAKDISEIYSQIGLGIAISDTSCQTKNKEPLEGGTIATIAFFCIILGIMFFSTIYDVYLYYFEAKPAFELLVAFSVFTNTRKLITLSKSPNQISCLHGIRVLSIAWIVHSHGYLFRSTVAVVNILDLLKWSEDTWNMYILNATVAVDTFFLLSGLVVCYGFMSAMKRGTKFNIFMFWIHRYIRLTPILAAILLVYLFLLTPFGSGPLWSPMIVPLVDNCKIYWWTTLLYIQNYVNPYELCVGETWYLNVDTQLFFLSPLILVPLNRWPKYTLAATAFLTLCSMAACFGISWDGGFYILSVANELPEESRNFQVRYYGATHTRASVWLMGIILGYLLSEIKLKKKKIVLNKLLVWSLWAIFLAIMLACVFSGHDFIKNKPTKAENAIHAAFMRPSWALGVSWVIFACVSGYGGPINWLLSLPVFEVLSKLTYGMYLLHLLIIYTTLASSRVSIHFSNFEWMHAFWGNFMFTVMLSLCFTLAFESPMIIIEKVLFGRFTKRTHGENTTKESKNPQV